MSKGLSKQQVLILELLRGTEPLQAESNEDFQPYPSNGEPIRLTTNGLLLELTSHGFDIRYDNEKQWQFTVRRACDSLVQRGLVEGYYYAYGGRRMIVWQAVKELNAPQAPESALTSDVLNHVPGR